MSYELTQAAIDFAGELSPCEKAVLVVICRHAADDGKGGYPSTATIAKKTGFNERTVRIAIRRLGVLGLISTTQSAGGRRYFTVNVKSLTTGGQETAGGKEVTVGQETTVNPGKKQPPSPAENCPLRSPLRSPLKSHLTSADADVCPSAQPTDATPPPHEFVLSPDSSPEVAKKERIPPCPYQAIANTYNRILGPFCPKCRYIRGKRKTKIKKFWERVYTDCECVSEEEGLKAVTSYYNRASGSDFITGRAPRAKGHEGWKASIDWLAGEEIVTRVAEGAFD